MSEEVVSKPSSALYTCIRVQIRRPVRPLRRVPLYVPLAIYSYYTEEVQGWAAFGHTYLEQQLETQLGLSSACFSSDLRDHTRAQGLAFTGG